MSTQQDDLVVEFLLGVLPVRLLTAYKTLARLNYPISDKHSLVTQLQELISADKGPDKPDKASADLISTSLEPTHFPIATPRSALEKFHATLSMQFGFVERSDRDFVERPDIADIYEEAFGRICGAEAMDAYSDAVDRGATEVQALFSGHLAGEECQRRLAQALRDFFRRRREPRPRPRPWF